MSLRLLAILGVTAVLGGCNAHVAANVATSFAVGAAQGVAAAERERSASGAAAEVASLKEACRNVDRAAASGSAASGRQVYGGADGFWIACVAVENERVFVSIDTVRGVGELKGAGRLKEDGRYSIPLTGRSSFGDRWAIGDLATLTLPAAGKAGGDARLTSGAELKLTLAE